MGHRAPLLRKKLRSDGGAIHAYLHWQPAPAGSPAPSRCLRAVSLSQLALVSCEHPHSRPLPSSESPAGYASLSLPSPLMLSAACFRVPCFSLPILPPTVLPSPAPPLRHLLWCGISPPATLLSQARSLHHHHDPSPSLRASSVLPPSHCVASSHGSSPTLTVTFRAAG
eukprot:238760-Rhodomonas_salina.3